MSSIASLPHPIESETELHRFASVNDESFDLASTLTPEQWQTIASDPNGIVACDANWQYRRYFSPEKHEPVTYPLAVDQKLCFAPFEAE